MSIQTKSAKPKPASLDTMQMKKIFGLSDQALISRTYWSSAVRTLPEQFRVAAF